MVRKRSLHHFVDKKRVREAIVAAEEFTEAPISVSISPYFWGNVRRTAEYIFRKHGLTKAPERNAVLFLVVPSRRQFAVVGDVAVHDKLGQHPWDTVAAVMQAHLRRGDATAALVQGIEELGRELARHFPRKPKN